MAINLTHRPDLDERVERLATKMGFNGRGRKTAVIEKALAALEDRVSLMDPESVLASLKQFEGHGALIAAELAGDPELDRGKPLSVTLQEALYDEHGLPR